MVEPIRVILDVDTGVDDAMAIALAVAAPTVDLLGVTTVAGNVEIDHTTANTLRVLDFVGATHIPVYRGMTRPLDRPCAPPPGCMARMASAGQTSRPLPARRRQ